MNILVIVMTFVAAASWIVEVSIRSHVWNILKGKLKGKLIFSSGRVITEIGKLDGKIRKSDFKADVIIGIGGGKYVGGGIVGNFLASRKFLDVPAHHFELPRNDQGKPLWDLCNEVICAHLSDDDIHRWNSYLIVDDRIGSGETIKEVAERLDKILREKGKKNPYYIWAAAIVVNPNSRQEIGDELWERIFCSIESPKQVDFPWFA